MSLGLLLLSWAGQLLQRPLERGLEYASASSQWSGALDWALEKWREWMLQGTQGRIMRQPVP